VISWFFKNCFIKWVDLCCYTEEYMGVTSFDIKRIIGELVLLGGPGAVLKRVEELEVGLYNLNSVDP
jgi:hypothetical protein